MRLTEASKGSVYLDFGLCLLPLSIASGASIISATDVLSMLFYSVATVTTCISGIICLTLWWKERSKVNNILKEIRSQHLKIL